MGGISRIENGYDPGDQLCTDDFAGKWPHNCNLSIKSIIAIGAYGKLFDDRRFTDIAKRNMQNCGLRTHMLKRGRF